jgi:hypothetical protein
MSKNENKVTETNVNDAKVNETNVNEVNVNEANVNEVNDTALAIKKMLDEAKAQAEEIIKQAKEAAQEITDSAKKSVTVNAAPVKKPSDNDDIVEIELFKDSGKYKDDVYVAVNGKRIQIKRGEPVKIKKKFAKVLENSKLQDIATAKFIQEKSEEFSLESKKRNI